MRFEYLQRIPPPMFPRNSLSDVLIDMRLSSSYIAYIMKYVPINSIALRKRHT
jgi:hypothetical protein